MSRPLSIIWVIFNLPKLVKSRAKIRSQVTPVTDAKNLKLFAKSDLLGKIKAVILDRFAI